MLTRMVDGQNVELSADEEAAVLAEWAENAPEDSGQAEKSDSEKLAILVHYIAGLTDTPQEIKDLNGD